MRGEAYTWSELLSMSQAGQGKRRITWYRERRIIIKLLNHGSSWLWAVYGVCEDGNGRRWGGSGVRYDILSHSHMAEVPVAFQGSQGSGRNCSLWCLWSSNFSGLHRKWSDGEDRGLAEGEGLSAFLFSEIIGIILKHKFAVLLSSNMSFPIRGTWTSQTFQNLKCFHQGSK